MRVRVEEREETPGQVCPLCRTALAGAVWTCERCAASLHAECAAELPRCPTLGCPGRPPAEARAPDRAAPLPRRPFVPAGEVVTAERPPGGLAAALRTLAGVALALLVLGGGLFVLVRLPYILSTPGRAARPGPTAVQELASVTLRGTPDRAVRVEGTRWGAQVLRFGDDAWALDAVGLEKLESVVPYPGRGLDLLHFTAESGSLDLHTYVGVTRDGRAVVARHELVLPRRGVSTRPVLLHRILAPVTPPAATPAEWVGRLRSEDPLQVLEALAWLSSHPPQSESGQAAADGAAENLAAARSSPEVRAAVEALRASADPWVREAADLAALHSGG